MNSRRRIGALAAVFGLLSLSACGGGGGGSSSSGISDDEFDRLRSDQRIVRLGNILERADTLLVPSVHIRYSHSVQGQTTGDSLAESFSCAGSRCVGNDGSVITVADLIDPTSDIGVTLTEVTLGSQGGFDTLAASASLDLSDAIAGVTVTSSPSAYSYGVWGQYGAANLEIADGPLSGRTQGVSFTGDISTASAYVVGDATGTNPAGTGSATWSGIAEAASTTTFQRRQGTATLTIADLSRPRVGVKIDVPGFAIGSPRWSDIPLTNGRFATGSAASDHLEGNFHGPNHSEAYGIFDTGAYVGAFGAKQTQ